VVFSFEEARCDAYALMDQAKSASLRGIEFPPDGCFPTTSPEELWRAREYAAERGVALHPNPESILQNVMTSGTRWCIVNP
jgi:hypothetical protein